MEYTMNSKGLYLPEDYQFFHDPESDGLTSRKREIYDEWAKLITWGRKNPVLFAEHIFGIEFMDYQRYIFSMSWNTPYVVWCCSRGSGKALDLDTRIPTPNGDKTMRDVHVGDYVFDEKGQPTKVINVSPIFQNHKCYEVEFADGEKIIADAEHQWEVNLHGGKKIITSTQEMVKDYILPPRKNPHYKWKEYRYSVDTPNAVAYTEQSLPIDPYILGLWIGDGDKRNGTITSSIDDFKDITKNITDRGYKIFSIKNDTNHNKKIRIHDGHDVALQKLLRDNHILYTKKIPDQYLHGSIQQRVDLLAGLLDSDGYISEDGRNKCEFSQCAAHYHIIQDVSYLLTSLGIKHQIKETSKKCQGKSFKTYRIHFRVHNQYEFFKLPRKKQRLTDYMYSPSWKKSIISIKEVVSRPTKCIMVDSPSHLYLCGEKNTVTHNSMLGSIFIMTKTLLIPNHKSYILCGVGSQSTELFTKIEKFVMRQIPSFLDLTDIYQGEVVKSASNTNGFVHNPASYHFALYNGSEVFTLNGNFDHNRSKRSNLNFYDEAAFVGDEELFTTSEPFTTQNAKFALSKNLSEAEMLARPKPFNNQLIYASSAGRTDQYFYKKYREASLHMDAGDKRLTNSPPHLETMWCMFSNCWKFLIAVILKRKIEKYLSGQLRILQIG